MKIKDLTDTRFGKLIALKRVNDIIEKNGKPSVVWQCKCDCGNYINVRGISLRRGKTKSCGCMYGKHKHTKHNKKERIYIIWDNMKQRCYNKKNPYYKNYGNRGIKICNEWIQDFMNFYSWAIANGYADNLTIDRINVNGNYEPNNCRWATKKQQNNNKRNNHYISYKNEIHTLKEWSEILKVAESTIQRRLKKGKKHRRK